MKHTKLIFFLLFHTLYSACIFAQIRSPSAESVMNKAVAEAAKSQRNIFIIFHASWCGWCHKMDSAMNDEKVKSFFRENYIVVHLTVDESTDKKEFENPGADDILKKYHGEQQGLPYWFILDAKGNFLADARVKSGSAGANEKPASVGCPASAEEVNYFVKVIKETSSLNNQQLALIKERFLKNKE